MARELSIEVTAQTQQAEANLGRVEGALQGVEKAANPATTAITGTEQALGKTAPAAMGAADALGAVIRRLGGPLGIAALFLTATKKAADYADSMQDLSVKTGIGVETLQKWEFLAKTSSVSMDGMIRAAQKLGADLAQGDKSAVAGVQRLGLSVEDLLKLNPEERFREVAIAIGKIEDPAMRAAAAEDILKRSGLELIGVMREMANGAEDTAPAMGEAWIEAGAMMQDAFDKAMAHAKNFAAYMVLSFPKSMLDGVNAWKAAMQSLGVMPINAPGLPGNPLSTPGPAAFDPLGGQSMGFIERELTQSTQALIRARTGAAGATAASASAEHALLTQSAANNWLVGARGPNVSGAFPWTTSPFPGWAPQAPVPTTGWAPPWAQYPGAPRMNAPGGGGGLMDFLRGRGGSLLGGGLGMLAGFLPGMSGQGASIGGGLGGMLGGLSGVTKALGGFASFLGPLGGIVGGLLGKLFKPSEAKKTQQSRAGFLDEMGGFDELAKVAESVGFSLDKMMSTRRVKDFEAEVKKLNDALRQQEEDTVRLDAAMQKYGFSIEDMGDKFQQTQITKGFKELAEDFRVLIGAGADFNEVAKRMAPEFGSLIHTAIETGSTVPRELQPIIAKMIELGVLTDRNGDKFTDLSQVPFAESMTQGFDRVVAALDKVINSLEAMAGNLDRVRDAAHGAGDAISNIPDPGQIGHHDPEPVNVSRGGIIRGRGSVLYMRRGGFVPNGTDTVPAMLTPGEMVIARDQVKNIARIGDQRHREAPEIHILPIAVVESVDVDKVVDKTVQSFGRKFAGNAYGLRDAVIEVMAADFQAIRTRAS